MVTKVTQPGKRVLQTSLEASRARKAHWAGLREAKKQGLPVVAAAGLLPREIWHAMGVPALVLEGFVIQVSAKQLAGMYCELAEEQGFARELCAAHLAVLGIAAAEEKDPYVDSMFVKPDLVIGSSFACISEAKSFLYWAERFGCPYHVVDVPLNTWGERIGDHAVKYVAEELRQMIAFLERHGFRFDEERLAQAVKRSRRTMELRQEVEEYRKAMPVPMTTVDALSCIGNTLITLLGSDAGVEIMRRLRDEVSLRVRDKQGVIGDEKLRLYLVGVPPVYNLGLLDYPEKYGAVVVKSDLDYIGGCVMSPELLVPERPLESLALKQLADIVNPCYETRVDMAVRTVKEYRIDGVIGLNKRGCRNLPAALRLVKDAIYRETGVPMTIFDLDGIDAREYNDAQVKANIDSFIETLIQHRVGG